MVAHAQAEPLAGSQPEQREPVAVEDDAIGPPRQQTLLDHGVAAAHHPVCGVRGGLDLGMLATESVPSSNPARHLGVVTGTRDMDDATVAVRMQAAEQSSHVGTVIGVDARVDVRRDRRAHGD